MKATNEKLDKLLNSSQKSISFVGDAEGSQRFLLDEERDDIQEVVNYVGDQGGYQKGFNNNYRNHPNFSYRNPNVENPQDQVYPHTNPQNQGAQQKTYVPSNQAQGSNYQQQGFIPKNIFQGNNFQSNQGGFQPKQPFTPPGFAQQNQTSNPTSQDHEMKNMLKQILEGQTKCTFEVNKRLDGMNSKMEGMYNDLDGKINSLASHVKTIDLKVAHASSSSTNLNGVLPSKPEANPKGFCNAILTSNENDHEKDVEELSRLLYGVNDDCLISKSEAKVEVSTRQEEKNHMRVEKEDAPRDELPSYEPPILFPGRVLTKAKKKILSSFKAHMCNIGVPLPPMTSLLQVPLQVEFIEAILANRERVEEVMEAFKPSSSSPLKPKTLPKLKHPGTFIISCSLGNLKVDDALCDSGANVNVMSLEMMKSLEIKAMKKYSSSITYADASSKPPLGLIEDYPLKVGDCLIPTDFVVVDRGKLDKLPLILGTPFLNTTGASIDFPNKRVTLLYVNPKVSYPIKPSSKTFCGTITNIELERKDELKVVNELDEDILDGGCLELLFEKPMEKKVMVKPPKQTHPPTLVKTFKESPPSMTLHPCRCLDGEVEYRVKCKGMSNPFAMVKAILTPELKEKGLTGIKDVMKEVLTIHFKGATRFYNTHSTFSTGPRSPTTPNPLSS